MILYKLTKKYSKYYIIFEEDKDDNWFINIFKRYKNKSELAHRIIRKDIDIWLDSFLDKKWNVEK